MPDRSNAPLGLRPPAGGRGVVRGAVRVPGSKSIAQRAVVLAGLCPGRTRLAGLPDGEDVVAALALVAATGARVERLSPAACAIDGRPPGPHRGWRADPPLQAGESGTLARLATAAFGFCGDAGRTGTIDVRGTLAQRSSTALFAALRGAGVRTEPGDAVRWPVRITPLGPPSEVVLDNPASSQEVSALLIALAAWPGEAALVVRGEIPSRPYLALTVAALAQFGATVAESVMPGAAHFHVTGPLRAPEVPLSIEPDASAAAVALAAGCLSGGDVAIAGITSRSLQGDARIVEHLAAFGCEAGARDDALQARGLPTRPADLDLTGEPDLAPVLAAVAARAAIESGGTTRLRGLGTLPGKESSRIEVLAAGLRAAGFEATATRDALSIGRGTPRRPAEPLDSHGDHRMAFAFALLGLTIDGVLVADPGCVAKSWPGFWRDLERAGASIARPPT
ncbi:MAG: hypothetical protein NTY35_00260 [Planctomycetota bacterium]|nr:hypothetical protein [Planctomycetota bacterium]